MLATQANTGALKRSKRKKKQTEDAKELSSESKSKATKAAEAEVSSPPKTSKGKRRMEEADVAETVQAEGGKKVKKTKNVPVGGLDIVVPDEVKKAGKKRESKDRGKSKKVVTEDVVLKGTKFRPPSATKPKTKSESEVDAVESSLKIQKTVNASSPEPKIVPSDDEYLHGFTSDDDDSSDDDDAIESEPELGVLKLPTIAKDDAAIRRRLELAKRQPTGDFSVIYIGHLPHGFYEDQLRGYFSQFGDVTRLRLSRNKKNGRSKHYAFLEFDSSSVAKIVAETMDNYLLMGHILRCEVIPRDKIHPEIWVGANKKWKKIPKDRIERVKHDKLRTQEEIEKAEKRLIQRQSEKKRKLEEAGIKYDFEAAAYKKKPKVVEI